jgi:hypothetical protein
MSSAAHLGVGIIATLALTCENILPAREVWHCWLFTNRMGKIFGLKAKAKRFYN